MRADLQATEARHGIWPPVQRGCGSAGFIKSESAGGEIPPLQVGQESETARAVQTKH